MAVGLLFSQGLANASCLQSLTKDHLVKNGGCISCNRIPKPNGYFMKDLSINVLTLIIRAYLHDQSMEHLSGILKRGGVRDLLAFFPLNKREGKVLEEYFKKENLAQVAEWWSKKQYAVVKDDLIKELKELCEREESPEIVCGSLFKVLIRISFQFDRSSLPSKLAKQKHLFLRLNSSSAFGTV